MHHLTGKVINLFVQLRNVQNADLLQNADRVQNSDYLQNADRVQNAD